MYTVVYYPVHYTIVYIQYISILHKIYALYLQCIYIFIYLYIYTVCIYIPLTTLTQKPHSGFICYYVRNTEVETQTVAYDFVTTPKEIAEKNKNLSSS